MIIESSANELYRVREAADPDLAHCWIGIAVKRLRGQYVPKANRPRGARAQGRLSHRHAVTH